MARWEPGARDRLERAALELFAEVGFGETTVPAITARAGLTTRTFFRHFADKREVLFAGEEEWVAGVADLMAAAPLGQTPMALVAEGLQVLAQQLEPRRDLMRARHAIIAGDDGLRERQVHKQTVLADVVTHGLQARGVAELDAVLTARTGTTVFSTAVARWLDDADDRPLPHHVREVLAALATVTADLPGVAPTRG